MLCKAVSGSGPLQPTGKMSGLKSARGSGDASEQQVRSGDATAIPPFLPSCWRSCIALFQSSSFSLHCFVLSGAVKSDYFFSP